MYIRASIIITWYYTETPPVPLLIGNYKDYQALAWDNVLLYAYCTWGDAVWNHAYSMHYH